MGNCFGKSTAHKREGNWRQTGYVLLRDAGIKALPSNVVALASSVKVLDVSNNAISDLPELELEQFGQLQRLVVTDNRLAALPASVGQCKQLKHLEAPGNRMTRLPAEIGQLLRLEKLLLQGNQLVALPASLGTLRALKQLNVSSNKLTQLPGELGECSSLEQLDASSNSISEVPVALGALKKLKVLQLDGNNIAEVPAALLQGCSMLHTLSLHDNPITPASLEGTPGYEQYDSRRRAKYDKVIAGGALLNSSGLDEGVDRLLKQ